ncbi:MAG: hypothetical protein R3C20_17340 [Planctomycetaceae bacterium]
MSAERRGFFEHDEFEVHKPKNEFRIFAFGGSTVQGNPYSIETSFTRFLEQSLNHAQPSAQWRVVNCGGISYASYRLVPLMQECLQYQPDLMIVCTGHNEFLEDITYSTIRNTGSPIASVYSVLGRFRSYRLIRNLISDSRQQRREQPLSVSESSESTKTVPSAGAKPVLSQEVDALLDHEGGLEAYVRDDVHADLVVRHFGSNLRRMRTICDNAGVPFLLIQPPSNLADSPPFKSTFSEQTTASQQDAIADHLSTAAAEMRTNSDAALRELEQAASLDNRFAFTWYQIGHVRLALGDVVGAKLAFVKARDEDVCPLRMTTALEAAMHQMKDETESHFIDAAAVLSEKSGQSIIGDNVLVDHIHPSFRGHQWIAVAIAEWMEAEGLLIAENSLWGQQVDLVFEQHIQSLDNMYFLKGRRRLQDLMGWAAGRAEGPPIVRQKRSYEGTSAAGAPGRSPL